MPLSPRERELLEFSMLHWRFQGERESAIIERFGVTATGYAGILNRLIDREDALREFPLHVRRLQRLRQARQRSRPVRRLG